MRTNLNAYEHIQILPDCSEIVGRPSRYGSDGGNTFALITRLKQLCNFEPQSGESVKLESLRVIAESLAEPDDKLMVFSQYVETLEWLSTRLDVPHALFYGQMAEAVRDRALAVFEKEPGPRALLVSLRAGGVGLNLNSASTVVLYDRWWNPAVENQAIQRALRFGRDRPLQVVRFFSHRFHRGEDRHPAAGKAGDLRAIRRTGGKCDDPAFLAQRASPPSRSARRAERFSRHNYNHPFVRSHLWRPSKR